MLEIDTDYHLSVAKIEALKRLLDSNRCTQQATARHRTPQSQVFSVNIFHELSHCNQARILKMFFYDEDKKVTDRYKTPIVFGRIGIPHVKSEGRL